MSPVDLVILAGTGLAVGVFAAVFGVGGGVIMVPFLVLVFGYDQHLAEGTSLLVIVPTAVVGTYSHVRNGFVDLKLAALIGLGGVLGAYAGARLALALDAPTLQTAFGIFVVLMGLRSIGAGLRNRQGQPSSGKGRSTPTS